MARRAGCVIRATKSKPTSSRGWSAFTGEVSRRKSVALIERYAGVGGAVDRFSWGAFFGNRDIIRVAKEASVQSGILFTDPITESDELCTMDGRNPSLARESGWQLYVDFADVRHPQTLAVRNVAVQREETDESFYARVFDTMVENGISQRAVDRVRRGSALLHYIVDQRSPEWHMLRRGRITATATASLLGQHKYEKTDVAMSALWRNIRGLPVQSKEINAAMQGGIDNEARACEWYANVYLPYAMRTEEIASKYYTTKVTNGVVNPGLYECGFYVNTLADFIGVSPDRILPGTNMLMENKVPQNRMYEILATYYVFQVMAQMWVTGKEYADLFAWMEIKKEDGRTEIMTRVWRITFDHQFWNTVVFPALYECMSIALAVEEEASAVSTWTRELEKYTPSIVAWVKEKMPHLVDRVATYMNGRWWHGMPPPRSRPSSRASSSSSSSGTRRRRGVSSPSVHML